MLIGYIRVSKQDGSQCLELQNDALIKAGVTPGRIFEDMDSGRKDDRLGLRACLKAIQPGNTLVVWKLGNSVAVEVAKRLGITTTTLYAYVNGDGSLKEPGQALLNSPTPSVQSSTA